MNRSALGVLVVLAAAGCGAEPLYPAAGTVTLGGVPVEGANVSFVPHDPDAPAAVAVTDRDGRFALYAGNLGPGARRGRYTVLVAKLNLPVLKPGEDEEKLRRGMTGAPVHVLPARYAAPDLTPFKDVEVPKGGRTDFAFDLEGPK